MLRDPQRHQVPRQLYSKEAEAYLKQLVEGKRVRVEVYAVYRHKRWRSTMFIGGNEINLAMIEAGLAEVYRGPESGNPYKVSGGGIGRAIRQERHVGVG